MTRGFGLQMNEGLRIAFSRPVVRRGLRYAAVVGAVLVGINHGDAILLGRLTPLAYLKMAFTVVVPYCVSVLSSVGASLDLRGRGPGNPAEGSPALTPTADG
jgi:hypothetical protein